MSLQRRATLNSGTNIPLLGFGTWRACEGENGDIGRAITLALEAGYRHFDCAYLYKNEKEIGEAIKASGIPRDELFINTKLWNSYQHPDHVEAALDVSLQNLQLDYLDSYMIHWPCPQPFEPFYEQGGEWTLYEGIKNFNAEDFDLEELKGLGLDKEGNRKAANGYTLNDTWRTLEKMVVKGKVRHISVSNFTTSHLEQILSSCSIRPAMNQVELHPYLPQHELVEFCRKEGIHVTAYGPLGSYGKPRLLEDVTLLEIANRTKATPAQVLLSWAQQRGTSVVPKSSNPSRIVENFQDITLSEKDMNLLSSLQISKRFFDCYPIFN